MSAKRIVHIPKQDLKQAAVVEHNLELEYNPDMFVGTFLEYHANCYVHTGSHCREIARRMRAVFPDARRCVYKPVGSFGLQGSTITTVFQFMIEQLE